jgi:hypothetical protein
MASIFLGLFELEDEGETVLRNIGRLSTDFTALNPTRWQSDYLLCVIKAGFCTGSCFLLWSSQPEMSVRRAAVLVEMLVFSHNFEQMRRQYLTSDYGRLLPYPFR